MTAEAVIQKALATEGRVYFDAIGLAVIAANALRKAGLICSCPHPMRCYRCALNDGSGAGGSDVQ